LYQQQQQQQQQQEQDTNRSIAIEMARLGGENLQQYAKS
jgi:hypothetical protein